jgi:hypothetical protein
MKSKFLLLLLFLAYSVLAVPVTVNWRVNSETNILCYLLTWETGGLRSVQTVKGTNVFLDLIAGETYCFGLSAVNDLGYESTNALEITYTVPYVLRIYGSTNIHERGRLLFDTSVTNQFQFFRCELED